MYKKNYLLTNLNVYLIYVLNKNGYLNENMNEYKK
jgi:hypothetical protein